MDDEFTVESAFNALPVFSLDESVTVIRNDNVSVDASFTFTFESRRGKLKYNDKIEPPNYKTNTWFVRPAKTQISLIRIFAVCIKKA